MFLTVAILALVALAGIVLYRVFTRSERTAAEPVEPPTRHELREGNVSPELPVADDIHPRP